MLGRSKSGFLALSNRVWIAHADKADAGIVISAGHVVQYAVWLNDYCTALVKEREIVHINTNGMDLCHLPLPPAFKEYCVVDYQQSSLSKNKHEEWSLASAIKVEVRTCLPFLVPISTVHGTYSDDYLFK